MLMLDQFLEASHDGGVFSDISEVEVAPRHVSTDSTWGLQSLNPMRLVSPISFIKFDTLPWDWQHESHSHVLKHIREVVMGLTYLISRS